MPNGTGMEIVVVPKRFEVVPDALRGRHGVTVHVVVGYPALLDVKGQAARVVVVELNLVVGSIARPSLVRGPEEVNLFAGETTEVEVAVFAEVDVGGQDAVYNFNEVVPPPLFSFAVS